MSSPSCAQWGEGGVQPVSKEEAHLPERPERVTISLLELPARSVDLSALNLTEVVNRMLSRALKGNLLLKAQPRPLWVLNQPHPGLCVTGPDESHLRGPAPLRSEWRLCGPA